MQGLTQIMKYVTFQDDLMQKLFNKYGKFTFITIPDDEFFLNIFTCFSSGILTEKHEFWTPHFT